MTVERGIEGRERRRYDGTRDDLCSPELDEVAVEAPLEIRLSGEPLATTMRTPGDDPALVLGFLFAEGIVDSARQVGTIAHCGAPGDEGYGNVIEVTPGPGVTLDPERTRATRRGTLVTASCGVCGRASIDDLLTRIPAVTQAPLDAAVLAAAPGVLASGQPSFERTGSVHAAAAARADGSVLALAEDVGRHNAVDKVIGRLLRADQLADARLLVVSGRVSFEIVQKAAVAGIGAVAAVSGPTTLAVDLAERAGIVLAGFVRGEHMNVYAHAERLRTTRPSEAR